MMKNLILLLLISIVQLSKAQTDSTIIAKPFQTGIASYYSKRSTGARTASGKILNNDSLVCAHRTLPFGTKIKVTNLKNGKSVIVKVIDRGPFGKGRVVDLSYAAADSLGILKSGLGKVEVYIIN
jgi:rare lipoprotein A